ncbi:MAG: transcriptional regulator [Chitinophagales bacterium]|nr:transcriptional regulator [Chitinophagales bacterium]HNI44561.1 transcriptional regulator [Chitinophagales bacterium]
MKEIIKDMDKAFDSRVRIAIMAIMSNDEWIDFGHLKEKLGVTDGNLASHLTSLEKKRFIEVHKQFIAKRPNTSYKITTRGREYFAKYVASLKLLLNLR